MTAMHAVRWVSGETEDVMKPVIKYQELAWWFWLAIGLAIGAGLLGVSLGFQVAFVISIVNLFYYIAKDRSLTSFAVQVREVWLAFVAISLWLPLWWLFIFLFFGMVMVVFFDRCTIAKVLKMMPWNKEVTMK